MSITGSINTPEEPFIMEEDCIYSMENRAFNDAQLKSSILISLRWYSHIPLEEVSITVKHGFVTLTGIVPWTYQKMVVSSMVQNITGVKGIINNINAANKFPPAIT